MIRWKRAGTALLSLLGIALTAPAGAQSAAAKQTPPSGTDGTMPFNDATDTLPPASQAADATRRFMQFIQGLDRFEDMNLERLQHIMGVRLERVKGGFHYYAPLQGGWFYAVSINDLYLPKNSVMSSLTIGKKGERFPDMRPVCGFGMGEIHRALYARKYAVEADYDTINGERGRLIALDYEAPGRHVRINPMVRLFPRGKYYPTCAETITVWMRKEGGSP